MTLHRGYSSALGLGRFYLFYLGRTLQVVSGYPTSRLDVHASSSQSSRAVGRSYGYYLSYLFGATLRFRREFFTGTVRYRSLVSMIVGVRRVYGIFRVAIRGRFLRYHLEGTFGVRHVSTHGGYG